MTQIFMTRTLARGGGASHAGRIASSAMQVMILAAGRSTRLGALGTQKPKPLVPVCGYPAIAFGLVRARGLFRAGPVLVMNGKVVADLPLASLIEAHTAAQDGAQRTAATMV